MSTQNDSKLPPDASLIYRTIASFQAQLACTGRSVASVRLYDVDDLNKPHMISEPLASASGHIRVKVLDLTGDGYEADFYLEREAWALRETSIDIAYEDLAAEGRLV
jgi:hypothetical protein